MEVRKLLITFRLGSSCSALRLRCPMTTRPDGPTSTPPDRAPLCSTLLTSRSFLGTMARMTWQWHTSFSCICGPSLVTLPRHNGGMACGDTPHAAPCLLHQRPRSHALTLRLHRICPNGAPTTIHPDSNASARLRLARRQEKNTCFALY